MKADGDMFLLQQMKKAEVYILYILHGNVHMCLRATQ